MNGTVANGNLLFRMAAAAVLLLAQDGKPKVPTDDVNPRALTTPLDIVLKPYWCATCAAEGLIPDDKPEIEMMHKPVEKLAESIGLKKGAWSVIVTPHFKFFSTLGGTNVKLTDSVFCRQDLERLKSILPKLQIGPLAATLDAHERHHLYHVRLERQYAHFSALTGNTLPNLGMLAPYEIYVFRDYIDHHAFCDRYIGGRQDRGGVQHHLQEKPNFILFSCSEAIIAQQVATGDGAVANHVFHNVAHCLVDGLNNYFRETPAWIEEGLGHYYERRENIRWNNFCWAEGKSPSEFLKPDWEAIIYSLVRRGRDVPFGQWCEKLQPGELNGVENGLSWSIVKWLIDTEPVRFAKMLEPLDDLEKNWSSAQLIDAAFGVSPNVLYQRWRDYVLANFAGK